MAPGGPADPLELAPVPGGTRIRLRVKTGASGTSLLGIHGGALKIGVTAAPERGRANEAVLGLLADLLGLPASSLEISSGRASRDKSVLVPLAPAALRERLDRLLDG